MFFRCNASTSTEEKAWRDEWQQAEKKSQISWHTLFWQKESRHFYKIFEEKIEEIFARILANQNFISSFPDIEENPRHTITSLLHQYKKSLLDELWSNKSYSNVKHVMDAARSLESQVSLHQNPTEFKLRGQDFENKIAHPTFGPKTKMIGGILFSYCLGVGALAAVLACCTLCPPFLGLIGTAVLLVPIFLGSKLSLSSYAANLDSNFDGEEIAAKLNSVKFG